MKNMLPRFVRLTFLLFIFFIPLGMKKFLFGFPTPFANHYTLEYTSAFLYASDILILILFFLLIFSKPLLKPPVFLAVFVLLAGISVFFAGYPAFAAYSFIHLLIAVLAAASVAMVLSRGIASLRDVAAVISLSAVLEAVIGFLQFVLSKSIGVWFLGETVFGPGTPGVARIVAGGERFVRAMGTMPHANILAGFLVLGLISLVYLFLSEKKPVLRCLEIGGIFAVLAGLVLTFSRSGWIVAGVSVFALLVWEFFAERENRRRLYQIFFTLLVSLGVLCLIFGWAISPRAQLSATEGPVSDRWSYNQIGLEMIESNPLGVGIGNQLFHAYSTDLFDKYDVNSLNQWQPIHNLYLIMASEMGIQGLVVFLIFVGLLVLRGFRNDPDFRASLVMVGALLVFGLFDHFLWDLQLGRLMLWVAIGILMGMWYKNRNIIAR